MATVTKLETGLINLIEDANTDAGNRIYPDILPQTVTYPAITYSDVSDMGHVDISFDFPRYNVTAWAERRIDAKNLAEELLFLLHNYKGIVNGVAVKSITKMNSPGGMYDRGAGVYYIPQDFKIKYER